MLGAMPYNLRGPGGKFICVPTYPRKRASKCGCALGLDRPCPLIRRESGTTLVRRQLDEEDIQELREHDWELEQAMVGLQSEITALRDQLSQERTFAGDSLASTSKKGRAARQLRANVKRYNAYGRVVRAQEEDAEDRQIAVMRHQVSERRRELADVREERREIKKIIRRGWRERPYEPPVAASRSFVTAWEGAGRRRVRRSARR
jgi:hypothetical protein